MSIRRSSTWDRHCGWYFESRKRTAGGISTGISGRPLRSRRGESMATGIKDKVAIIGMGCSKFGERWDCGTEHLLSEAFQEALQDAGIERQQIEAAWFGSCLDPAVGNSAIPLSTALRLEGIPVTRV